MNSDNMLSELTQTENQILQYINYTRNIKQSDSQKMSKEWLLLSLDGGQTKRCQSMGIKFQLHKMYLSQRPIAQSLQLTVPHCILKFAKRADFTFKYYHKYTINNDDEDENNLEVMNMSTAEIIAIVSLAYTYSQLIKLYTLNMCSFLYFNQITISGLKK